VPDIAIFDLDYTLTKRGTWGRFVVKTVKFKPWLWLPLAVSAGLTQWRYKQGHANNEVKNGLRPGAVKALEAHRAKGDIIIIVSFPTKVSL